MIGEVHESTLTFSEFNFSKRWSIFEGICQVIIVETFYQGSLHHFCCVPVVVDTASLSTGIGTDTENKGNII